MRDTLGKARYHLERAEEWQVQVERLEAAAMRKAAEQEAGRMSRKDRSSLDVGFIAGTILTENFAYSDAVGNRNAHQRRAEIYLLAAAAGISETVGDLDERGKIHVS